MNGGKMLKLENICFSVEGKEILKNINLVINDNEITTITGHNGSGKSTLVKIIMGILLPTSGKIIYNDKDITTLSINERANLGIAYAFQQPVCFKGLTVRQLINSASNNSNNLSQICDYLSKVGLCAREYIDREVDKSLSGGELKRIEIATVLARNAKLNIFDEPEAGIDIWSFDNLLNIFSTLKKNKTSTIIVSHQEKILNFADKIILLNDGVIEKYGTRDEVLPYLNTPTCSMLKGVKDNG
jgi:Fe-S cluster assembly ATP-binding protein